MGKLVANHRTDRTLQKYTNGMQAVQMVETI